MTFSREVFLNLIPIEECRDSGQDFQISNPLGGGWIGVKKGYFSLGDFYLSITRTFVPARPVVKHTGWCISSRTTAIPYMVRQGNAPVYYLCVLLLIWNILARTTEVMECEQTMGKCVM